MPLPRDLDILRPLSSRTRPWISTVWKGALPGVLAAGEDHPGHPEEDDVVAGDQHVGGVEIVQILGLLGPAQGGEGPQGGGEPGVQHVLVLLRCACRRTSGSCAGVLPDDGHLAAVVAVPGGDLVAPPQLPGDAPVADVLHPVDSRSWSKRSGTKLDAARPSPPRWPASARGSIFTNHWAETMGSTIGVAAVAGAHVVLVGLHLDQVALRPPGRPRSALRAS